MHLRPAAKAKDANNWMRGISKEDSSAKRIVDIPRLSIESVAAAQNQVYTKYLNIFQHRQDKQI